MMLTAFSTTGRRLLPGLADARIMACLLMLAMPIPVLANQAIEPLEQLRETAEVFLATQIHAPPGTEVRIEVGQLDARLRLARCDAPPEAELAPGARTLGKTTVRLSCTRPVAWSIFVPAYIEQYTHVVTIARPVARQQLITAPDLQLERLEVSTLRTGYYDDLREVVGMQARRALAPGHVVTATLVAPRTLIERGQIIMLHSGHDGLMVRMRGEALEDGALGESIRVRNLSSQRIVEGYVEATGTVRIPF